MFKYGVLLLVAFVILFLYVLIEQESYFSLLKMRMSGIQKIRLGFRKEFKSASYKTEVSIGSNQHQILHALKNEYEITLPNRSMTVLNVKINEIVTLLKDASNAVIRSQYNESAIAVLVLVCNRVTVKRCLEKLIKFRPSAERFPIIVSHICQDDPTHAAISLFQEQIIFLRAPKQPVEVSDLNDRFKGYYRIAKHYVKALNQTFFNFGFNYVIIVEDDLEISNDFFEYFIGTLPILKADPTLFCVSAWNDNGKPSLIQTDAPELLHRTDFFPGLGWMISRDDWLDLAPKWPDGFWDDWLRQPEQMKGRSCIRPEISRTKHFSKFGVSGKKVSADLQINCLNEKYVNFSALDLNYLLKDNYDAYLLALFIRSKLITADELLSKNFSNGSLRILYCNEAIFQKIAKMYGLMSDYRSGIPRSSYNGIVSFFYNNVRIYLATAFLGHDVKSNNSIGTPRSII